jgi:hypothetical protein
MNKGARKEGNFERYRKKRKGQREIDVKRVIKLQKSQK